MAEGKELFEVNFGMKIGEKIFKIPESPDV